VPLWDGSDPRGRRILVHSEQGFGDVFQFIRYASLLADRGADVIVECHVAVRELVESVRGVNRAIPMGMILPEFDLHCPLLTLPRAFDTTLECVPSDVPYLHPNATKVQKWRARLSRDHEGATKVGLVWAGAKGHINDKNRSMRLEQLAPLAEVRGVKFVSLQVGGDGKQVDAIAHTLVVQDLSKELKDFSETAALIANLDLVLTVDTSVAHLAGALGKPVWVMLPFAPDWRWLLGREDSPWYPTMRLFRQQARKDWAGVVERVSDALGRFTVTSEP
jgi:hypothetical protein